MRATILTLTVALVLLSFGTIMGQNIIVDHVDGLNANGNIDDGAILKFHMRLTGDADAHFVISNGFEISAPNLNWTTVTGELNPNYFWDLSFGFPCFFDLGMFINYFADGVGADTIGFGGAAGMYGVGLPPDFDDIAYTFTIGPVTGKVGDLLTVDSSFYPPAGRWVWDIVEENVGWGGPYVYQFGEGCAEAATYLTQDPLLASEFNSGDLTVNIECEDFENLDQRSITVNRSIVPWEIAVVDDKMTCLVSMSHFVNVYRPIQGDYQGEYTVEYDVAGVHKVLTGDVNIMIYPGDFNMDGFQDQRDIVFMVDYMWNGGPAKDFLQEMDIDGNGHVDALDLRSLVQTIY